MKLLDCGPDLSLLDSKGRSAVDYASAQDAIWPILGAKGYKRTPKARLIQMGVIEKANGSGKILMLTCAFSVINSMSKRHSNVTESTLSFLRFSAAAGGRYQSRPGSSYVMRQLSRDSNGSAEAPPPQTPKGINIQEDRMCMRVRILLFIYTRFSCFPTQIEDLTMITQQQMEMS